MTMLKTLFQSKWVDKNLKSIFRVYCDYQIFFRYEEKRDKNYSLTRKQILYNFFFSKRLNKFVCVCVIKFQIYKVIGSVNFFFFIRSYAPREITGDILEQLQQLKIADNASQVFQQQRSILDWIFFFFYILTKE